jgi:hypothetical protein
VAIALASEHPGMAFIRKQTEIDAPADEVWAALSDWGALHTRLVPGFVVDTQLDGEDRIVTFFNGAVVREVLVSLDENERRLAWTIVDGPYAHHHASAQVFAIGDGRSRFVWCADLLEHALAGPTAEMMERGTATVRETLSASPRAAA